MCYTDPHAVVVHTAAGRTSSVTGSQAHSPDENQAIPSVLMPCQGRCPGTRGAEVITCEGACSALTMRWLAPRLVRRGDRRARRGAWLRSLMFLFLVAAGLPGWSGQTAEAAERSTVSYAITVADPAPVKAGLRATALIRVVPRRPYKSTWSSR